MATQDTTNELEIVGQDDPRYDELRRLEEDDCAETARLFRELDRNGLCLAYNPDAPGVETRLCLGCGPDGSLDP